MIKPIVDQRKSSQSHIRNRKNKEQLISDFIFDPNRLNCNSRSALCRKQFANLQIENHKTRIKQTIKQDKCKHFQVIDSQKVMNKQMLLGQSSQQIEKQLFQAKNSNNRNSVFKNGKIEKLQNQVKMNNNMQISSNFSKQPVSGHVQSFQRQIFARKRNHKSSFKLQSLLQPNKVNKVNLSFLKNSLQQQKKPNQIEMFTKYHEKKPKEIQYDSFFFIDNITNRKILLKDIANSYSESRNNCQFPQKIGQSEKQYKDSCQGVQNCWQNTQRELQRHQDSLISQNQKDGTEMHIINSGKMMKCKQGEIQYDQKQKFRIAKKGTTQQKTIKNDLKLSISKEEEHIIDNRGKVSGSSKMEFLRSTFEQSLRAKTNELSINKKESERKDMCQSNGKSRRVGRVIQKQKTEELQMKEINACLNLMKNTKLFQLDSLRQKIFKVTLQSQTQKKNDQNIMQSVIKQKKQLKRLIDSTITHFQRKQLSQFLSSQKKCINPKIMGLHKSVPNKINKYNIGKAVQQILENIEVKKPQNQVHKKIAEIQDVQFQGQAEFKIQMLEYLHKTLKKGQFLIQPQKSYRIARMIVKSLRQQCENNFESIKQTENLQNSLEQARQQIRRMKFKQNEESAKLRSLKDFANRPIRKLKGSQQKLIGIVRQGSLFELQTELLSTPQLVNLKDQQGNSLLHIAAKYNHSDIFGFLLKKCGAQTIKLKNDSGKTVIDIANLFGATQIQQKCNESIKMMSLFSLALQQKVDIKIQPSNKQ